MKKATAKAGTVKPCETSATQPHDVTCWQCSPSNPKNRPVK